MDKKTIKILLPNIICVLLCIVLFFSISSLFRDQPEGGWIALWFFSKLTILIALLNIVLCILILICHSHSDSYFFLFVILFQKILYTLTLFYIGYVLGAGGSTLYIFQNWLE